MAELREGHWAKRHVNQSKYSSSEDVASETIGGIEIRFDQRVWSQVRSRRMRRRGTDSLKE